MGAGWELAIVEIRYVSGDRVEMIVNILVRYPPQVKTTVKSSQQIRSALVKVIFK
jgi:hypothetical protein